MGIPNIVELAFLARTVDYQCHFGIYGHLIGLDDLVRYFLHYTLQVKDGQDAVPTSNWSLDNYCSDLITGMSYVPAGYICALIRCLLGAILDIRACLEVGLHLIQILRSNPAWTESLDYFSFDCGYHREVRECFKLVPRGSLALPMDELPTWSAVNPSYPTIPRTTCIVCGIQEDILAMEQHT